MRRAWRSLRWLIRGVLGEDAYERYLAHHVATHPESAPMTAAEFWRDKTDRQDVNPQGRCC
ncbi:YbdD/YjiX family protein [Acaricomes phytoseiuli]|nr:YbdD/YjiX family protein [Acaricomes phytoseiuli]MCW1250636.1 YbdD/YjiX family protein [Acaricomes phytoseiuli]